MARPTNTAARREKIARGLLKVMAEKGYERATTADVASAAEVSRGIVHYHFENKLEILFTMFDVLIADHTRDLEELLRGSYGDPVDELKRFIAFHLATGNTDPDLPACWIALGAAAQRESPIRERYQAALIQWVARAEAIIEGGVKSRVFKCAAPRAAAVAIVATMQGYLTIGITTTTESVIPFGTAAKTLEKMAEALLGAKIREPEPFKLPAIKAPLLA